MESTTESLARENVDAWCTYYLPLIYRSSLAYLIIVSSQRSMIPTNRDLFKKWFEALAGRQPLESWMKDWGVDDRSRHVLLQYFYNKAGPEGVKACLVLAIRMLANDKLPPSSIKMAVNEEFLKGSLYDLYARLEKQKSPYTKSILDNINRLGE
jgi:hypothetical protein